MRETYVHDLQTFQNMLSEQSILVIEQLYQAMDAFNKIDSQIVNKLKEEDSYVNQLTNAIEREAYRLIALQQPVAEDLRLIFSVMNVSLDLERIGDHAVLIAKNILRSAEEGTEKIEPLAEIINGMAAITQEMLTKTIDAFNERDTDRARAIAAEDEKVDAKLKELYHETSRIMEKDRDNIHFGINYIAIGNSLERIGDYITNICERIIYLESAIIVDLNR